jgi:hypothetical protein
MFCVVVVSAWADVSQQARAQEEKAPEVSQPVTPAGEPVLEEPTLHCLGAYWIVPGDEEERFRVDMAYRKLGDEKWTVSLPMMRVRKGDTMQKTHEAELNPPADAWLFAGSVVNLSPGTDYELKLTLVKPGAASVERILKARTASEPTDPADLRTAHVVPGDGGGDGTEANPYKGLAYAQSEARPGTLLLVHKGTYAAPFVVNRGGAKDRPVIWRGAGDGEAIIDGGGAAKFGVEAALVDHVRFEKLTIKGAYLGVLLRGCSDLAIRRCRILDVKCGIYGYSEKDDRVLRRVFIADNLMEGPFAWGEGVIGAGADELRGIQITGIGHEICHNRIVNFKDGVDTFPSKYCAAIDIHHNDIVNCRDDGIEMDFSERNTRCFENRITNVHQGISEQPVYGGPVYIFRNALYNVGVEAFKLHHNGGPKHRIDWWPSGVYIMHNTIVKKGEPCILWSSGPVYNVTYRNNLFIGGGRRAMDFDPKMVDCDFDYDGFGGGPWDIFMKWQGVRYKTFDDAKTNAPIERHAVLVDADTVFASGVKRPESTETRYDSAKMDLRPSKESAVVDAGEPLLGFNDGYAGKAPDIGAYEAGRELPFYGPRDE